LAGSKIQEEGRKNRAGRTTKKSDQMDIVDVLKKGGRKIRVDRWLKGKGRGQKANSHIEQYQVWNRGSKEGKSQHRRSVNKERKSGGGVNQEYWVKKGRLPLSE